MNENDAYIFDVEQPTDWTFHGEAVWVSGWFISKVGAVFSDIRAVIDDVPHFGIFGLPRPEIETRYRGAAGLPYAGFLLRLQPPRGAREIRFELLDAGHRWVEILRVPIRVKSGPAPGGRYRLELLPEHLRRLLQTRRHDPATHLDAVADSVIREGAAVPLDTLPNPPYFGALERPELVGGTQYGKLRLEGWIIHREKRIRRLLASTHPRAENELVYGQLERREAGELFPGHPYAARSQYFGLLDFDEATPGPAVIRMFAELEDGTRELVFTRRFYPRTCASWEQPLPCFSRAEFYRCLKALHSAARRRHVHLGDWRALWSAARKAYRDYQREAPALIPPVSAREPHAIWLRNNALSPRLCEILAHSARAIESDGVTCLLLIDTDGCTSQAVAHCAISLQRQIFTNWRACFFGPVAPPPGEKRFSHHTVIAGSERVRLVNRIVSESSARCVSHFPADGQLPPCALVEGLKPFAVQPVPVLVYTDEDRMDESGRRSDPIFKPGWSPAFACSGLFPGHLTFVRRDAFIALGGLRSEFSAAAWYDLLLRLGDQLAASEVIHVSSIGFHAARAQAKMSSLGEPTFEHARRALDEAATRRRWPAAAFLPETAHHRTECSHQLRWSRDVLARWPVTIVIPTRDRLHLLQECVEQLEETIDWQHVYLVIVDDHSRDTDVLRYLERIQQRTDLRCTVVRTPDAKAPFNYSRLVNAALPHVATPLILHLNNDVNALAPGWLEEMVGWFTQADVGVVGAKLIFPDRTLNHTGIVIGPHGGLADTPWAHIAEADVPSHWHAAVREVSAVTGACLLTRTDLYRELGGFNEADFGVAYNDVDYCLRARAAGFRVLYTPQAKLMHWGSATRGVTFDEAEHLAWLDRYRGFRDPYFSAHWRLEGAIVRSNPQAGGRPSLAGPLRVLLLTHNLNLEGAPLFLLEYATHLARERGWTLQVLAGQDGPLRRNFESLGARVTLSAPSLLFQSQTEEAFYQRLDEISAQIDWEQVDLVVANTLLCFWGVLLARRADRASLFYIHESTSVFRAFEPSLSLRLHSLVHTALQGATRTLFLCEATRRYYADDDRGNFRLVPSWIDLDRIAAFQSSHCRESMRAKHGLAPDEVIVANIGTVCERKGQHVFLRAIEHFNRHYRGPAPVRFLMVGARPGVYLDLLHRDLANLRLPNVTFVNETREAFDFFAAADVFVCTSYEESFPRVVMEAMAFRTPIVSTDAHGIVDLIGQRQDGYLVTPGDAVGLSRMLLTCLTKERSGKSLAPAARSKVHRFHDARLVLPYHADLARETWLAHPKD